jgi:hypothetical protein
LFWSDIAGMPMFEEVEEVIVCLLFRRCILPRLLASMIYYSMSADGEASTACRSQTASLPLGNEKLVSIYQHLIVLII